MTMTSLIIAVGAIIIISNSKSRVTSTYGGGPAVDRPDMASILAEKIRPPEFNQKRVVEDIALNLPQYSDPPFDTQSAHPSALLLLYSNVVYLLLARVRRSAYDPTSMPSIDDQWVDFHQGPRKLTCIDRPGLALDTSRLPIRSEEIYLSLSALFLFFVD
jgi:hypothetical protein